MTDHACSEARFLKDIEKHTMKIIKDDGVYRHLVFSRGGNSVYHFHIHTYPGGLLYTGDMGTYVFERLEDMFEFFRTDREYAAKRGKQLAINLGYWTEKLVAVDGNRGGGKVKEFDIEKFKTIINEYRLKWVRQAKEYGALDKEQRRELWDAVEDDVIRVAEDGDHYAYAAAHEFSWQAGRDHPSYRFEDFFEHDVTEYTHSIVWCLYALAWAIQQYDDFKTKEPR